MNKCLIEHKQDALRCSSSSHAVSVTVQWSLGEMTEDIDIDAQDLYLDHLILCMVNMQRHVALGKFLWYIYPTNRKQMS